MLEEMEGLRRVVKHIAYSPDFSNLPLLHRSLLPFLSLASSAYRVALSLRRHMYLTGFIRRRRLPVPVISVGNLTWGGNGKTPMVEFLSLWFSQGSVAPLVLTRGYAGGDEVRMLQRHFIGTTAKIGVGANRAKVASSYFDMYGNEDLHASSIASKVGGDFNPRKIGVVLLDDGMQHMSLLRDVEIVMVNGVVPWGNQHLVPLGPLREPLISLQRADVIVVHHADLVSAKVIRQIKLEIERIKESVPVYFTRMAPSHFFMVDNILCKMALSAVENKIVLCISAIGSPDAFVKCVKKLGPLHIEGVSFSDHHFFQPEDISNIKMRIEQLVKKFSLKPILVITEKDYDRDREIFLHFYPYDVLVLCSQLQFVPRNGCSEQSFKKLLMQLMQVNQPLVQRVAHCQQMFGNSRQIRPHITRIKALSCDCQPPS